MMTTAECKSELIAAHRAGDWDRAAKLSQVKQRLKKRRFCKWPGCGLRINFNASQPSEHCGVHSRLKRYGNILTGAKA